MPAAVSENTLGTLFGAAQRTADAARGARPVDRFRAARTDTGKAAFRRSGTKVRAGKAGNGRGTARRRKRLSGRNRRLTGPPRRQRDAGRGTPVPWHLRARKWQNGRGRQQLPELAGPDAARHYHGRSAAQYPGKGGRPTRPEPMQARVGLAAMPAPFAFAARLRQHPKLYHLLQNRLPRPRAPAILRAKVPFSAHGRE